MARNEITFFTAILAGIGRCNSVRFLTEYYGRWKEEIQAHEQRAEIVEAFGSRKAELTARDEAIMHDYRFGKPYGGRK